MEQTAGSIPPVKKRSGVRKFFFISAIVIAIAMVVTYVICGMTYSEGTRSGILMKVSKKGFIFKTYEGEMNIGGISEGVGTIMPATVFRFSITDRGVYNQLEKLQGQRVVIHYREVIKNFFWQGDTNYFVHEASPVK
jgi:hypothetical protein